MNKQQHELTKDTGDYDLLDFCPTGYRAVHLPRPNRKGGGIALVYRDLFLVEMVPSGLTTPSFEQMVILLRFNSVSPSCIALRRSQPSAVRVFSSLNSPIFCNHWPYLRVSC